MVGYEYNTVPYCRGLCVCLMSFGRVGLPATAAIFPQIIAIAPDKAESKFQHLVDPKTQKPYTAYYYNKGL